MVICSSLGAGLREVIVTAAVVGSMRPITNNNGLLVIGRLSLGLPSWSVVHIQLTTISELVHTCTTLVAEKRAHRFVEHGSKLMPQIRRNACVILVLRLTYNSRSRMCHSLTRTPRRRSKLDSYNLKACCRHLRTLPT